jgi:hypothetical protein
VVNEIREVKAQLEVPKKRLETSAEAMKISAEAEVHLKKIDPIENEMIGPKIQATEDSLNYPVKLNDKIWYLAGAVDSLAIAPTAVDYEIYQMLAKGVDEQAAAWKQVRKTDLAVPNGMIRKANVLPVVPAPEEKKAK